MRDAVLFPDTAAAVCTYLNDTLGVTTGSKVPNPRPAEFYRVQRVGGASREVVIDDATVIVEAWAPTDEEADDLAQLARAHLLALNGDFIGSTLLYRAVDLSAPSNDPDPISGSPRSTATYQVMARGAALDAAS